MKTLTTISFLLLAVIGYGQNDPQRNNLPNFDRMHPMIEVGEEYLTVDRFTKLWKEYKAECYNDSILERQHSQGNDNYCIKDYRCLMDSHWKDVWVHKQPSFEGFMNWLITKEEKQ